MKPYTLLKTALFFPTVAVLLCMGRPCLAAGTQPGNAPPLNPRLYGKVSAASQLAWKNVHILKRAVQQATEEGEAGNCAAAEQTLMEPARTVYDIVGYGVDNAKLLENISLEARTMAALYHRLNNACPGLLKRVDTVHKEAVATHQGSMDEQRVLLEGSCHPTWGVQLQNSGARLHQNAR